MPQLLGRAANRATFAAELLAHATAPEAVANVIAFPAVPVGGAIVSAYCA